MFTASVQCGPLLKLIMYFLKLLSVNMLVIGNVLSLHICVWCCRSYQQVDTFRNGLHCLLFFGLSSELVEETPVQLSSLSQAVEGHIPRVEMSQFDICLSINVAIIVQQMLKIVVHVNSDVHNSTCFSLPNGCDTISRHGQTEIGISSHR